MYKGIIEKVMLSNTIKLLQLDTEYMDNNQVMYLLFGRGYLQKSVMVILKNSV